MTKLFTGGRTSGKTTAAIKEASKHNLYILVPNKIQAMHVAKQAEKMNLKIPFPVTLEEVTQPNAGSISRDGIIVEEAQWILEDILKTRIHMMTATVSDELNIQDKNREEETLTNAMEILQVVLEESRLDRVRFQRSEDSEDGEQNITVDVSYYPKD